MSSAFSDDSSGPAGGSLSSSSGVSGLEAASYKPSAGAQTGTSGK